jgi:outer membrane immunogenic protein
MFRLVTCAGAAWLIASSAYAADVEAPPLPYDWSGPYIGLHAGYLWGDVDVDEEGVPAVAGGNIDGFVGGVLAGFNYQWDPLVLGIEGDFGFTDVDGHGSTAPPEPDFSYELNWNAHVRARAGFALDRALLFIAGGLAIADLDIDQDEPTQTKGTTYWGYSIGGGIDYALTDEIIVRAEYLHDEYDEEDYSENGEDYTADLTTDTVRGALIWKFMP